LPHFWHIQNKHYAFEEYFEIRLFAWCKVLNIFQSASLREHVNVRVKITLFHSPLYASYKIQWYALRYYGPPTFFFFNWIRHYMGDDNKHVHIREITKQFWIQHYCIDAGYSNITHIPCKWFQLRDLTFDLTTHIQYLQNLPNSSCWMVWMRSLLHPIITDCSICISVTFRVNVIIQKNDFNTQGIRRASSWPPTIPGWSNNRFNEALPEIRITNEQVAVL
jgi:hypothetical protein